VEVLGRLALPWERMEIVCEERTTAWGTQEETFVVASLESRQAIVDIWALMLWSSREECLVSFVFLDDLSRHPDECLVPPIVQRLQS
jgi:hypothetical protein